jgi:Fe-Mn family superoxide dismutase
MTPGTHNLPPLPYDYNALEPFLSERLMRLHHDKHHAAYVEGLNEAELALAAARDSGDTLLVPYWESRRAFNEGGHVLHSIFWRGMTPVGGGGEPGGLLGALIERDFGGYGKFRAEFAAAAKGVEGSGWAMLFWKRGMAGDHLEIAAVLNHENQALWQGEVVLVCDVWEHAYYLDYLNERAEWVDVFLDNLVDWDQAASRILR